MCQDLIWVSLYFLNSHYLRTFEYIYVCVHFCQQRYGRGIICYSQYFRSSEQNHQQRCRGILCKHFVRRNLILDGISPTAASREVGRRTESSASRPHEKPRVYTSQICIPWKYGAINFPGRVVKRPRRKVLFLTDHEIPARLIAPSRRQPRPAVTEFIRLFHGCREANVG